MRYKNNSEYQNSPFTLLLNTSIIILVHNYIIRGRIFSNLDLNEQRDVKLFLEILPTNEIWCILVGNIGSVLNYDNNYDCVHVNFSARSRLLSCASDSELKFR